LNLLTLVALVMTFENCSVYVTINSVVQVFYVIVTVIETF